MVLFLLLLLVQHHLPDTRSSSLALQERLCCKAFLKLTYIHPTLCNSIYNHCTPPFSSQHLSTPIAIMQPATITSSFSPVFPVSSADAELTTTMPSLSIPLPAPSTIMGAADLEHALGAAPCADAGGYWHCCKCFSGPHLADINVGCATCHHTRCGECSTK
ncbi:hypothetical protein JOL62DRAFT_290332 [Phyllosticta paracitricarpa]|uniref:Uncharacterized protein n=2 Tax=Phyllosticta TaxID=121621 RepID=A0ABR1MJK6_9PEZI